MLRPLTGAYPVSTSVPAISSPPSAGPCPLQRRREVGRERALDVDPLAGDRMVERQAGGVQELARQSEHACGPVLGVAGDRVPDRLQVDADLMRAAGLEAHAQERERRQRLGDLEVRARIPWLVGVG